MTAYPQLLNDGNQQAQSLFLLFEYCQIGPGLSQGFKIMLEQTSNTAQLLNHHSISSGNKRTPAKNFPADVLGSGQTCNLYLPLKSMSFLCSKAE